MSAPSIQDRINFIRGVNIATPQGHAVVHSEGQDSAAVVAGSALAFIGKGSAQVKADVINSTLFAQLAADLRYDRQNDPSAWVDYYRSVLEQVGYNVRSFDLVHISNANSFQSVDNLVLKLAAKSIAGESLAAFVTMVESLKQAMNEPAIKLFDSYSKSANKANFQLGVASDNLGNTGLQLGIYYYTAEKEIDTTLFYKFGLQEVKFDAANLSMSLDNQIYSLVREEILEKLGSKAEYLVKEIVL